MDLISWQSTFLTRTHSVKTKTVPKQPGIFEQHFITGDERWSLYVNKTRDQNRRLRDRGQDPGSGQISIQKYALCLVGLGGPDFLVIVSYKPIDRHVYLDQLYRVNQAIQEKRFDKQGFCWMTTRGRTRQTSLRLRSWTSSARSCCILHILRIGLCWLIFMPSVCWQ